MPMINSKVTVSLPQEKRDILKAELGKAVAILGKPESYLMLGFEDNYDLYFGGKKLEKGAFISVEVLGDVDSQSSSKMSGKICEIFEKELGIPGDKIYITYSGTKKLGLVFPILSRNRFSMCLKGIARAVDEVVILFSYPNDEVGNPLMARSAYVKHKYSEVTTESNTRKYLPALVSLR